MTNKVLGLPNISPDEAFTLGGFAFGLYGRSGFGKTTLAGSIAKSKHAGRVQWIDCQGAAYVLAGQNLPIDIVQPINFTQLEALNKHFLATLDHGTYVFDHATHMQVMHLNHMSSASSREWKHYTRSQEWFLDKFIEPWVSAAKQKGINVIFIFQEEKDQEEDTKRWITRLNTTPHVANQIPYYLDYIGSLSLVKEGSEERVLSFAPSPKTASKTRRPMVGPGSDIPKVIYHPDLSVILNTLRGDSKWPNSFNKPQTAGAVNNAAEASESNQATEEKENEENG